MSIISDKSDVFQKIAILKTSSELYSNQADLKNGILSSVDSNSTKNNNDPFIFVIDILKVVSGSDSINKVLTQTFSFLDKSEVSFKSKLKEELKSTNGGDKNTSPIPDTVKAGVKLHVNKIDYFDNLYLDENSPEYKLYTDDFTKSLSKSVKNPGASFNLNSSLISNFDSDTGYFTLTPSGNSTSHLNFVNDVIDKTKFIDTKVLLSSTLDMVFNTRQKNSDQLNLALQLDTVLGKFITEAESDDSYFTFDTNDLNDIQSKISLGTQMYTEVGCGRVGTQISMDDIVNITSAITYPVSKKVIQNTINNLSNTLVNNTNNPNLKPADKQSVSNNFLANLLNSLKNNIIRSYLASPQMNIIYSLINLSTPDDIFDPIGDLQKKKNLIKCLITKIINDLVENIYKLIKREILEIVSVVALIYTQEGLDKYKKILLSLV